MAQKIITPFRIFLLLLAAAGFFLGPKIGAFIESQNQFFDEVRKYNPDLEDLQQHHLFQLDTFNLTSVAYDVLDPATGRLKFSGWSKRDQNLNLNTDSIAPLKTWNLLKDYTKFRHETLIVTFAKKKVSFYRAYDIGLNTILLAQHLIKKKDDSMDGMPYDMTVKEPAGYPIYPTDKVGFQPFNISSDAYTVAVDAKDEFDREEFKSVFHFSETCKHPFVIDIQYEIFEFHEDEALSVFQAYDTDSSHFITFSSKLGLKSEGRHKYTAFREQVDVVEETVTNIMVTGGMPLYGGRGFRYHLSAGGYFSEDGYRLRFGLEIMLGVSAIPGVSNANKNAFTINGKLHKLGAVDLVDSSLSDQEKVIKMQSRDLKGEGKRKDECQIVFEEENRTSADVNAVAIFLSEAYAQGYVSGWCYSQELNKKFSFKVDALLIHDRSVY